MPNKYQTSLGEEFVQRHALPERRTIEFSPVACLLMGLSVMVPIVPEARLTLFDVVAGILVLFHWRLTQSLFKATIILLSISLLAMAVSAYLNQSGLLAFVGRGYQPIALLLELIGYFILIRGTDDRGHCSLALGVMLGICFHYFYPSDLRVLQEPIKFLMGIPLGVSLLALYALAMSRSSVPIVPAVALMIACAIFCFLVGARSIGGVYFVSAITAGIMGFVRLPANYSKFAPLMILVACVAGYGFTELYTILALNGVFGDRAAGIAAFQSSFGSIILGGRPEIIVNLRGVMDSPLFGVGINNYPAIYLYEMINLSIYSQEAVLDITSILYHSTIFGTAFESGLIADLFWIFVLYRAIFSIPLIKGMSSQFRLIGPPLLLMTIWHLLYSPPIPYNRFIMAIGLGFSFYIYADWKERRHIVV